MPLPLTLQADESDFGWRSVPDVVVVESFSGELASAGSFRHARVGAMASDRVGAGEDLSEGVPEVGGESVREKPACPVTWRRTMRRVRMNDMRSGSSGSGSALAVAVSDVVVDDAHRGTQRDDVKATGPVTTDALTFDIDEQHAQV